MKKILVVKMRHHGDVLLTSPVFSNLRKAYPLAEIDAMVYADTAPMLQGHPAIRTIHTYDRGWKKLGWLGKLAKEIALLRTIRKEKYDLVLNLTEGDRGAIVALISQAPCRVGFDPEGKGFMGKRRIYTHLVKMCKTPRHTVEKNLDALRRIGIIPGPDDRDLIFAYSQEDKARALSLVQGLEPHGYILLHPASRWKFKCWPTEKVAQLIEELHAERKKIVLTSSPDPEEMAMVQEIVDKVPHIPLLNLAGKTSLKELGALIAMCEALICVDSVPLHLSSALQVPVVALFGPSSPLNWGPWQNPRARVVTLNLPCQPCFLDGCGGSKKSDCLLSLPVSRVLEALQELCAYPVSL
jgi:heptosyltransferase III